MKYFTSDDMRFFHIITAQCRYFLSGCGGSLDVRVFVGFFLLFFSLKTSSEGYIIYKIVNCVSVI